LWSTEWHRFFDDKADYRSKLSWRNRFVDVTTMPGLVQYYSTGEEVLATDVEGFTSSGDSIDNLFSGQLLQNVWTVQEKSKGSAHVAGASAGASSGGWGLNDAYEDLTPTQKNKVSRLES
jgi:hypothetical protein